MLAAAGMADGDKNAALNSNAAVLSDGGFHRADGFVSLLILRT
jgi:hypothetical protein